MLRILLAPVAILVATPAAAQTEPARPVVLPSETILRVQGAGFAEAPPARMVITIGVETVASTAAEALDANNRKLAPVIEALHEQGVEPDDIQTSGLEVDAQYDEGRGRTRERINGFRASNELTVTSRAIDKAGDLVSLLFDAGANSIDGPNFYVAEEDEAGLTRAAETAALREARAQADAVAAALGMKVSRILLVSDRDVYFSGGSGTLDRIIVTGSRIARTPIEPGKVTVTAEYNVEFALVPM